MPRLKATANEIQTILALLAQTPPQLAACTAGLDEAVLRRAPGKRSWSAVEVLAHLRACDDLWSYSMVAMLADENPTLWLPDERRWAKVAGYAGLDFAASLQAFTLKRRELLHVLQGLPLDAWSRSAVIEERRHSVFSQARRLALHEDEHQVQIEALAAGAASDA